MSLSSKVKFTRLELLISLSFALGLIVGIFSAVGILAPKYAEVLNLCVDMIP